MSEVVYLSKTDDSDVVGYVPLELADQLAEALQFMIIEQGREVFGDEMDDIKRGNEALTAYRKAKGE